MTQRAYGQQGAMEDPTMVGTLDAQARMIWPLEKPLLERLGLPRVGRVLDLGCGTGRIAGRVAAAWPAVKVTGLDMFPGHLAVARREFPSERHGNLTFVEGDARRTGLPAGSFDAVLIRHVLHAIPDVAAVLSEAVRLLAPGGLLYELAEDYQGLLFDTPDPLARDLFLDAAPGFLPLGTNLLHGREAYRRFLDAGLADVRVDAIVVDTLNAPREEWARMFEHWRDGYAEMKGRLLGVSTAEIERRYAGILDAVRDPRRWVGWWLIAASGRR
jgi:ubiquinone/menaquinone biosynthesis C-methylase UbiE